MGVSRWCSARAACRPSAASFNLRNMLRTMSVLGVIASTAAFAPPRSANVHKMLVPVRPVAISSPGLELGRGSRLHGRMQRPSQSMIQMKASIPEETKYPAMSRASFLTSMPFLAALGTTLSFFAFTGSPSGRFSSTSKSSPTGRHVDSLDGSRTQDARIYHRPGLDDFGAESKFQIVRFEPRGNMLLVRPTMINDSPAESQDGLGLTKTEVELLGDRNKLVVCVGKLCNTASLQSNIFTWGREHPRAEGSYEFIPLPSVQLGGQTADRRTMKTWKARKFKS